MEKPLSKGRPLTLLAPDELLGRNRANALIKLYNAFINGKVLAEDPVEILVSDSNIIIKIGKASGGSSGGSSSYRGEYSSDGVTEFGSGPFKFGDIVRISPSNALSTTVIGDVGIIPGVYICTKDNPTDIDTPNHPLSPGGEFTFWHWLSTWPSTMNTCASDGSTVTVFADQQDDPSS